MDEMIQDVRDWDEIRRLACLPSFNVEKELDELRREVARELKRET